MATAVIAVSLLAGLTSTTAFAIRARQAEIQAVQESEAARALSYAMRGVFLGEKQATSNLE